METKKKSPASAKTGLKKEGKSLIDSARIIASSSDPVKLVSEQIRYQRLSEKLYRKNLEVEVMNKEKAIEEAKENYDEALKKIELADKVCKKVEPHLPKGWKTHEGLLVNWGQINFCKHEKANALEFRVVCDMVEKALGKTLMRWVRGDKSRQNLIGYTSIRSKDGNVSIDVHVELGNPEGCEVTFKRTWETKAVVDDACLGIRQVEEAK